MRLLHCACGPTEISIPGAQRHDLPAIPTRKDLRFLDTAAKECLPVDPTPSLAEIQKNPAAPHLGDPQFAPQQPEEPLRVIVSGSDAALGAVLTRMMRGDYLWAEVAYLPSDVGSPAAVNWGVDGDVAFACEAPVIPAACVRTDKGLVVAGSASIYCGDGSSEFIGEIIVDSETLLMRTGGRSRRRGLYGARLVPTMSAPGIAATTITTPLVRRGLARLLPAGQPDPTQVLTGRAVQAGGESITLLIDAHAHPPTTSTTFYRHLRDIQSVRTASL